MSPLRLSYYLEKKEKESKKIRRTKRWIELVSDFCISVFLSLEKIEFVIHYLKKKQI